MSKRFVLNLVKYLLALGLLTYVVWTNWDPNPGNPEKSQGLKYVWQVHFVEGKPVHFGFMALAGLLLTASLLISFVRWHLLVRAQDLPFALPNALRLGAVGFFFSTFLPGSIGGLGPAIRRPAKPSTDTPANPPINRKWPVLSRPGR